MTPKEIADLAPFDAGDPFDAMAELFRTQVTNLALDAYKVTIYRDLDTKQQLECFISGALTGIVGVCLASVKSEGYDAIMEYLAENLPLARFYAESIRSPKGSVLKNNHDAPVDNKEAGQS
jgi:hypothetical protein